MLAALRSHLPLYLAGAAAYTLSTLFSAMKPIVLTGFIEQQNLSNLWAGLLAAMPFVGIASAALLGGLLRPSTSLRWLAMLLGGLLVLSEALTAPVVAQPWLVLLLQWIAGLCVGLLMGASSARIARQAEAPALFGLVDMTAVLLMAAMVTLVGYAVDSRGLAGAYELAAVLALALIVLMLVYRETQPLEGAAPTLERAPLRVSRRALAVVAMGVLFVTTSGLGFAYMFSMAAALGMDYAVAGERIGLLLFVSAFACAAGGWCAARFGPYWPLALAYLTCAGGWALATHTQSSSIYLFALVPAVFSLQFCFPVLLTLAGALDEDGRWASIATPVQTSGFAWAAILAGVIVSVWDVQAIGWATALGMVLCLGLLTLSRPPLSPQS